MHKMDTVPGKALRTMDDICNASNIYSIQRNIRHRVTSTDSFLPSTGCPGGHSISSTSARSRSRSNMADRRILIHSHSNLERRLPSHVNNLSCTDNIISGIAVSGQQQGQPQDQGHGQSGISTRNRLEYLDLNRVWRGYVRDACQQKRSVDFLFMFVKMLFS